MAYVGASSAACVGAGFVPCVGAGSVACLGASSGVCGGGLCSFLAACARLATTHDAFNRLETGSIL